ncbi:MAG: alpha/beta hydrolase [Propioniciclava sp.]|uniref:alpha/beta hydrolase family protein n=1 Tax=Propioniciclava sp. TaxID=2038686 RepID=UPI0039E395CB
MSAKDEPDAAMSQACAPADTVSYGPDAAQVYDVRLPAEVGDGVPSVVVIHGGFWRACYDRSHAAAQAQGFAERGHPTAVLEYRRTGMPGGGYPGTLDDIRIGLAAVVADGRFPEPRVVVGHSAGGQLAVWALSELPGFAGAVSLAGCVDLGLVAELNLGDGALAEFIGGSPEEFPERYTDADPSRRLPTPVPVVLIHGDDDDEVPWSVSGSYAAKAARAGSPVKLVRVPGVGHYELIDPTNLVLGVVVENLGWLASRG